MKWSKLDIGGFVVALLMALVFFWFGVGIWIIPAAGLIYFVIVSI